MRTYPETLHQLLDFCISYRNIAQPSRHPIKSKERYKPFFIIGSGRSGNTLLRRLINNHSALTIPPETYVLAKVIKRYRQNSGMKWANLVEYIFAAFEYHPEFETFDLSLRPLVQELKESPNKNRNLAYLLNRFYCFCGRQADHGCLRWGDKTPQNTFYLERIFSVFPDAKFVHVLRDGCDVVASYINAGIYKSYEEAAQRWSVSVDLVETFYTHHPGVGITVRYEELVSEPKSTLTKLCGFLEVDYEEQMLQEMNDTSKIRMGDVEKYKHHANVLKPINKNSIGKGRAKLSVDQKTRIEKIIGNRLERLGYESCTF